MTNHAINGRNLGTAIVIGSLGTTVLGIEPVLLSAMVHEGRIAETTVGALVTTELLAIAIGSVIGTRLLARFGAHSVAVGAGLLTAALNAGTIGVKGDLALIATRGAAGAIEGILMALALVAIARSRQPERASGLFLAAQTFVQFVAVSLAPSLALEGSNADGCLAILSGCGLAAALIATIAPRRLVPPERRHGSGELGPRSFVGLAAVGAFTGATLCIWGYLGLWISHNGFPAELESRAVALSLAAQIIGALVAAHGSRLLPRATILSSTALAIIVLLLMLHAQHDIRILYALSAAFSFLWLFTLPAFAGLLVEIDPTRRALLYIAAVQLAGAALLPTLAGIAVGYHGIGGAFWLAIGVLAIAMALVAGLHAPPAKIEKEAWQD